MGLVSTRFFEPRAGNRKQATTSIAYCELHPLWRFKIRIQEVRGHHFDEKKIRIVWSRRPYLRRFGGSFTVPELQSLLFHHRPREMVIFFRLPDFGTWHRKKGGLPQKNPTQLQFFFHPFPFSVALLVSRGSST